MKFKNKTIPGRLSCILPTYNRPNFLHSRINNLLSNSYKDIEIIIIDDCSDYIIEIPKSPRIKYVKLHKNSGCVSIPRNIGISMSTGEFIAHTDDDTLSFCHAYDDLIGLLQNNKSKYLSYGNRYDLHIKENKVIPVFSKDWNPLTGWGVDGSQIVYRKSVYEQIPFLFPRRACDWELCKEIYKLNPGFLYSDNFISVYKWHGANRSLDETTKTKEIHPEDFLSYF